MKPSQKQIKLLLGSLVALACAGMTALGFWQLARGHAKQALLDDQALSQTAQPQALERLGAANSRQQAATAIGHYSEQPGLLLDGQSHQRSPGVAVWNAFELVDGSRILVNRGWLPLQAGEPPALPDRPLSTRIEGQWRALPVPGMRLAAQTSLCTQSQPTAQVVNYPTIEELRCVYGAGLRDGLLDLAASSPDAFTPIGLSAAAIAVPPSRHYGYAAQWWAFAATLAVLYLRISFFPRKS